MIGLWNLCLSEMIWENEILHLSRFFQISSGWQQRLPHIMASQPTPLTYLPPRNMALLRETNVSIGWLKNTYCRSEYLFKRPTTSHTLHSLLPAGDSYMKSEEIYIDQKGAFTVCIVFCICSFCFWQMWDVIPSPSQEKDNMCIIETTN